MLVDYPGAQCPPILTDTSRLGQFPLLFYQVTKHGLRGHIKEPVGTHGLLKAAFSAPIKQNDTVMLILYKRVYPKLPLQSASSDSFSSSASQAPGGYKQLVVI